MPITTEMIPLLQELATPDQEMVHDAWGMIQRELKTNKQSSKSPLSIQEWSNKPWTAPTHPSVGVQQTVAPPRREYLRAKGRQPIRDISKPHEFPDDLSSVTSLVKHPLLRASHSATHGVNVREDLPSTRSLRQWVGSTRGDYMEDDTISDKRSIT